MKVKFTKLAALLLAGVALFATGCTDYEVDIQKVDKKVDNLTTEVNNKIASLEQQIAGINATIATLETKAAHDADIQTLRNELAAAKSDLQDEFNDKINKGLITRSVAEAQAQQIQDRKNKFDAYAAQKEQEIAEEQMVMQNQIGDAIKKFVDAYNVEKEYAIIIATQGNILPAPVVAGDPSLDITDDLLAGLNAAYIKTKETNKK
jgi:outer membrane protein